MASITFTIGAKTKTFTVSAPNVARFQAWALAAYPTVPNPAYNPALPTNGSNPVDIPNPDPVTSVIDGLWAGMKNNVISYERGLLKAAVTEPVDLT